MEELNHKDKMKSNVFLYNEKVFSSPYLINVDEIDSHFVSSYNKLNPTKRIISPVGVCYCLAKKIRES